MIGGKDAAYTTTLTVTTTGPALTVALVASKDKAKISAIEIHAVAIGSPVSVPFAMPTPTKSPVIPAPTPALSNGPVLINCGSSSSFTDSQNRTWLADAFFDIESGVYNTSSAIANTIEDALYQTERTGETIAYSIPRPPGTYSVTLHFAEI
jgi:Malectin domain